jgi:hypothetical protein
MTGLSSAATNNWERVVIKKSAKAMDIPHPVGHCLVPFRGILPLFFFFSVSSSSSSSSSPSPSPSPSFPFPFPFPLPFPLPLSFLPYFPFIPFPFPSLMYLLFVIFLIYLTGNGQVIQFDTHVLLEDVNTKKLVEPYNRCSFKKFENLNSTCSLCSHSFTLTHSLSFTLISLSPQSLSLSLSLSY